MKTARVLVILGGSAAWFAALGHAQTTSGELAAATVPLRTLALYQSNYRIRAGERVSINAPQETIDFVSHAKNRSATVGQSAKGFAFGPSASGDQIVLGVSLMTPPGQYSVSIAAVDESGQKRTAKVNITVDPLQAVPSSSSSPPVVLLNGYQFTLGTCPISTSTPPSADTFGDLQMILMNAGVPVVYFFDNCVESPGQGPIEALGDDLGQFLNMIRYDTGALVPQVDVIGHSMGGLIVRSDLEGLQPDGTLAPPANPRVRKFVEIATPNFGSFLATSLLGEQVEEMIPGSSFLWTLATWNQRGDDLRGVDALAIIGNGGYQPLSGFPPDKASDGVVTLTSASLGFARDSSRTRILPYCHSDFDQLDQVVVDCLGSGIAKAPETATIITSFLQNTPTWQSVGSTPPLDTWLSQYGGIYFTSQTATGQSVTLNSVTFGSVGLSDGGDAGRVFYNEFIRGTDTFSENNGAYTCGPFTQPLGYYYALRCKNPPVITSVGPLLAPGPGWVIQSNSTITINGTGFGQQQCPTCAVSISPSTKLSVSSWSDQSITAFLPTFNAGVLGLTVTTTAGSDYITFMAVPPSPPHIAPDGVVGAGLSTPRVTVLSPNAIASVFGDSFAPAGTLIEVGSADLVNGHLPTVVGGVCVYVSNTPAPIFAVTPTQINFQVPQIPTNGTVGVQVATACGTPGEVRSSVEMVPAASVSPEFFYFAYGTDGKNAIAAFNATTGNPVGPPGLTPGVNYVAAAPGDILTLFFTGGGRTNPAFGSGELPASAGNVIGTVALSLGGSQVAASDILYTGVAPGFAGLYQLNIRVPSGTQMGNQPAALSISSSASPVGYLFIGGPR